STVGPAAADTNLTGVPRTRESDWELATTGSVPAACRSARIRNHRRLTMSIAPTSQIAPTVVALSATRRPASPIAPSGRAHARCVAKDLSRMAPKGRTKLSDVATHTQYFAVALPRTLEVRTQAANQTSEA